MSKLGHKIARRSSKLGKKVVKTTQKLGRKLPEALDDASKGASVGAKILEAGATVATLAGQPEIAAPLGAGAVVLEGSSGVLRQGSRASSSLRDGNHGQAINDIQKGVVQAKKTKSKYDKKFK